MFIYQSTRIWSHHHMFSVWQRISVLRVYRSAVCHCRCRFLQLYHVGSEKYPRVFVSWTSKIDWWCHILNHIHQNPRMPQRVVTRNHLWFLMYGPETRNVWTRNQKSRFWVIFCDFGVSGAHIQRLFWGACQRGSDLWWLFSWISRRPPSIGTIRIDVYMKQGSGHPKKPALGEIGRLSSILPHAVTYISLWDTTKSLHKSCAKHNPIINIIQNDLQLLAFVSISCEMGWRGCMHATYTGYIRTLPVTILRRRQQLELGADSCSSVSVIWVVRSGDFPVKHPLTTDCHIHDTQQIMTIHLWLCMCLISWHITRTWYIDKAALRS